MLKLYGVKMSNFYCMAKQALVEKGLVFEEVVALPSQEPDYLAKSPMGKMPTLATEFGFIAETSVIFDYLEDLQPNPNLYPQDAFAKARVKQVIKMVELYIETPAHQMVGALFGAPLAEYQRETAKPLMERGLAALRQLGQFAPWVCGEQFTYADIFLYRSLGVVTSVAEKFYDWDALALVPELHAWRQRMAQRSITAAIDTESQADMEAFMKQLQGAQ